MRSLKENYNKNTDNQNISRCGKNKYLSKIFLSLNVKLKREHLIPGLMHLGTNYT